MTPVADYISKQPASYLNRSLLSNSGKDWFVYSEKFEEVREIFESLKYILDYSQQSGIVLDKIGENYRQKRNLMTDSKYRIFLAIALQKSLSKGDIFSMNEVCSKILMESGTLYKIEELCYLGDTLFLDGSFTLNGELPFSGTTKRPKTIKIIFSGNVNDVEVVPEFNIAVNQVKAGGTQAIISYRFEMTTFDGLLYSQPLRVPILDGSWNLDGATMLSGDPVRMRPYEIAIGSGGIVLGEPRTPLPTDTGLQTEILRKLVETETLPDGSQIFKIQVKQGEIVGQDVNEIALFDEFGDIMYNNAFEAKHKDNLIIYEFIIAEIF